MAVLRGIAAVFMMAGLAGGSVAQGADPVSERAAVYMTYQSNADDIGARPFKSTKDIDEALATLGSYNADQLTRGWISYSALIASQDPDFRANVRDIEAFYGRDRVVSSFATGGGYARSLKGGDNAVSAAIGVTDTDLPRIYSSAAIVREQGYTLQSHGWAKSRIRNSQQRAENVRLLQGQGQSADNLILAALTGPSVNTSGDASLVNAVATAGEVASAVRLPAFMNEGFTGGRKKVNYGKEPVANQIASVAALRILGADSVDQTKLSRVMLEPSVQGCMRMQNLQLQGCVAGVGQEFEVPHCISQHALKEIADCLGAVYK